MMKMKCNFYDFLTSNTFIYWLLSDKEERRRISFYKKMKKHIRYDLKEIERNKENDVEHLLEKKYYNIIVQKLSGNDYNGLGAKEELDTRSKFWFPFFARNFDFVSTIKKETSDKMFVYNWIMSHINYEIVNHNNYTFDNNIYVNLK